METPSNRELFSLSEKLFQESQEIVTDLNLLSIANRYSECHQIGSSVMGLQIDEDIDFTCYVENKVSVEDCFSFAQELVMNPKVELLRIKNFLTKVPYYQFKVYIDPYSYKGRQWQIAFSFQVKSQQLVSGEVEKIEWVKSRLSDEKKLTILRLKYLVKAQQLKIPSATIYNAVLENGVSDFTGLQNYINSHETK